MLLSQKGTHAARAAAALINLFADTLRQPDVRRAAAREMTEGSGVTPADVMLCNVALAADALANPTEAMLDSRLLLRATHAVKVFRCVVRGLCPELAPLVPDVSLAALGGPTQDVCCMFFGGLRDILEAIDWAGETSPHAAPAGAAGYSACESGPLRVAILLAEGIYGVRSYIHSFFPQSSIAWISPGTVDAALGRARFDVLLVEQGADAQRLAETRRRLTAGAFEMRVIFSPEGVRPTPAS